VGEGILGRGAMCARLQDGTVPVDVEAMWERLGMGQVTLPVPISPVSPETSHLASETISQR
jgi:hypothetical protein